MPLPTASAKHTLVSERSAFCQSMTCTSDFPIYVVSYTILSLFLFAVSFSELISKNQRRDTCEPGMFEGIVGDLGSSPSSSSTSAYSAGNGDSRIGEDDDAASPRADALAEASSPPAPSSR